MQSETIVLLFDVILFMLGVYAWTSAIRMKKTAVPSAILIPKEEMPKMKNTKEFCRKMYVPTILFAVIICLYGAFDIANRLVWKLRYADFLSMACFFIACILYIRKLQQVKGEHL